MFKINVKNALLFTLAGIIAGSLGITNASAEKVRLINTGKHIDNLIHKVDINKLSYFRTDYDYLTKPSVLYKHNMYQTYKLKKSMKLTDQSKRKTVTLPKGTVVAGMNDGHGNLINVNSTALSIKNQKKVFKTLNNWRLSYPLEKYNGGAKQPYTRNTAFSYQSLATFPFLSVKSNNRFDGSGAPLPFISVTADSQLVYHTKGSRFKPTRYVKIKKYKRTHSTITYYLAKPIKGVATQKVKSGKTHLYRVTLKMGNVFQAFFNSTGDSDGYNITIDNGRQAFFFPLGYLGSNYIRPKMGVTGVDYVSPTDEKIAAAFIQKLY